MPDPPLDKGTFFSHGTGKKSAHIEKTQLRAHILQCSAKGSPYSKLLVLGACLRGAMQHGYRAPTACGSDGRGETWHWFGLCLVFRQRGLCFARRAP